MLRPLGLMIPLSTTLCVWCQVSPSKTTFTTTKSNCHLQLLKYNTVNSFFLTKKGGYTEFFFFYQVPY